MTISKLNNNTDIVNLESLKLDIKLRKTLTQEILNRGYTVLVLYSRA
jgi:hypothetical protein